MYMSYADALATQTQIISKPVFASVVIRGSLALSKGCKLGNKVTMSPKRIVRARRAVITGFCFKNCGVTLHSCHRTEAENFSAHSGLFMQQFFINNEVLNFPMMVRFGNDTNCNSNYYSKNNGDDIL
mmetsp:Transcript_29563/g.38065  ORF Transcript_29563/g.38065 Transcript_29563/m.38065 type:complete len:127 (-) Transcript_29563:80-460(-)